MPGVIELRRLRYFLAVAGERSFTRAAEHLHIAQPALSRQIRLLEQELGVRLLERTTQRVEPTEAGRMLMERGAALCEEADRLWHEVRGFADGGQGTLRLGYSASIGYETAPTLLAALAERHPGLAVDTRLLSTADIVSGVADGTLDAGLVRCPPPLPELVRTLFRLEHQGVLMPAGHPLAERSQVPVTDLADETLLVHPREANPGHYDAITSILTGAGISPRLMVRALSFDAAHTPVLHGQALTVVGQSAAPSLPPQLVWRPLSPTATIEIHLLTRGNRGNPALTRLLRTAIVIAREHGWIHAGPTPAA
ncbi:hypothetical protein ACZ90_32785 [Streptomyces albus subsp. albus]|nr:hypothetical protein ACZ90_32785 [Streptomyces albus subsp. albus]